MTVAYSFALLVYYFIVYSPLMRRLDPEVTNVRGLLLIFPDEVTGGQVQHDCNP